jgi:N-methylhydantoinase B
LFENISVSVPEGSFLNPRYPAAVGVRHATAIRINDALIGCMAQAVPGMIPAPSGGTVVPTVLAEQNPRTGTREVMVIQSLVGGTGARQGGDGVDGRDSGLANLFNTPIERTEADAGVIIETYALRPDSGGPGRWRGGTGLDMSFRILKSGTAVLGRGLERFVFRPWGIAGGMAGETCRVILNRGTAGERDLGKLDMFVAEQGDLITILTAGGGGFGDPFARDPQAVLRDVRVGFVSPERAAADYGVVIRTGVLDDTATAELRANRTPREGFGFGPERLAWEAVFTDELMLAMNERLLRLPVQMATNLRRRIIDDVVPGIERVGEVRLETLLGDPEDKRRRLRGWIEGELNEASAAAIDA